MFSSPFLQALLLINVFFIGVLVAIAVRHAYLHFQPPHHEIEKPHITQPTIHIPTSMRDHLLQVSEEKLQAILNHAAADLQRDLTTTTAKLDKQLTVLGTKIIDDEMARYQTSLTGLRKQADATLGGVQAEMGRHQTELSAALDAHQTKLMAKLAEEAAAQQQQLRTQIDTKLADAVAAFLTETLGHNVDLGAQSAYLTAMLNEHKAELTKGLTDEA